MGPKSTLFGYPKSKALAEKAAWDFIEERKNKGLDYFELSVINPGLVLVNIFFYLFKNKESFSKYLF